MSTIEAPRALSAASQGRHRHRHSRARRRLPLWAAIVGWVVIGGLGIVLALRLFAWDRFEPFAILNDLTLFIYLPAWIVVVVAAVGRRFVLAAAALLVVVLQIVLVAPEFAAAQPAPAWTDHAPSIRLLDANVYNENQSMAGYAAEIKAYRPGLLTMEEASPTDALQLKTEGALVGLPHQVEIDRYDPFAFFVASRYPIVKTDVVYNSFGLPLIFQMTVVLPSGPQPLWVVHTIAPLPRSFHAWKDGLATIDGALAARGTKGLLVVGDFNATWQSRGFRSILSTGLTDGAAARGKALDMTWSQVEHPLPPFVRIDHVLTGAGVAVTRIQTGPGPGSDHRDLQAVVAFDH
jgi:endonuclease/exonuclease/phosphatase (EEP) superfamily protein YafD